AVRPGPPGPCATPGAGLHLRVQRAHVAGAPGGVARPTGPPRPGPGPPDPAPGPRHRGPAAAPGAGRGPPAATAAQPPPPAAPRRLLAANDRRRAAAAYRAMLAFDSRGWLGEIAAPTLVVCGADDAAVPRWHAEQLARGIRGAELRVVPEGGHFLIWTHPAR